MNSPWQSLLDSPFGRTAYRPLRSLVRYARRRAHPEVPPEHAMLNVNCRNKRFSIEVRRWSGSDRLAVQQCFHDQQYDMPVGAHGKYVDDVYRGILASGKTPMIVDCGANIGASVLWFNARYPEAHIVAVEPAPDNFALLRTNTRGMGIDLRQTGIGRANGTAWLSGSYGGEMGYHTSDREEGTRVEIVSLESVLASKPTATYAPFLLKVDIEGAEKSLFAGSAEALDRFPLIIMEPHDWMFPGQQTSVEFFRFHAAAGREFAMNHENVASIGYGR
jgi:FkbM family methyltransferase